jgi:hypothetical protein
MKGRGNLLVGSLGLAVVLAVTALGRCLWFGPHASAVADVQACGGRVMTQTVDGARYVLVVFTSRPITDDDLRALDEHGTLRTLFDAGSHGKLLLNNTQVTGKGIRYLQGLSQLEHLDLTKCQVQDEDLESLKGLTGLRLLLLQDTAVTDAGLGHLAALRGLHSLGLIRTKVTPGGAAKLRQQLPQTTITEERDDS